MTGIGNPTPARYTSVAIALHWSIAALVVLNLTVGWWMEDLVEPYRTLVVRLHQSSGMTVLVLALLRIGWRLTHRPPPFDADLSRIERMAASVVHFALYAAMLGLPLSGWALISANPPRYVESTAGKGSPVQAKPFRQQKYIMLWGIVPLRPIGPIQDIARLPGGVAKQEELHERIVSAHAAAGYLMLALIVIHMLGALKHQFLDGKGELYRMGLARFGRRPILRKRDR
ncbi:cytochrome b [Novosphingobium sp.]|uniref:cytochrome b n=1 Tax=Novosphingobium sp. TaxID=1874826 RepID=UPI00286EAC98|nr:cytochrome b [Novosphingobium sp.]